MGTDGRTDMTKLKVAFRNFANAANKKEKLDFLRKQIMSILRNEIIFKFPYLSYNVHVYVIGLQSRLLG